jgi:hypothetical protein
MIIELFVLALAGTIRPTSLAAIYALLAPESRRALMCAYVAAGLTFTIAVGVLVVFVFHGIHHGSGTDRTKGIADVIGGAVALGFGLVVVMGRAWEPGHPKAPHERRRWATLLDRSLTPWTAAVAGPVTHLPGPFYLIALNVIVAHNERVLDGTLAVLTYNAVWFAVPIVALGACLVQPAAARAAVQSLDRWVRAHAREILVLVSFAVGAALVFRGVRAL